MSKVNLIYTGSPKTALNNFCKMISYIVIKRRKLHVGTTDECELHFICKKIYYLT